MNKSVSERTPINEKYHLIDPEPINENDQAGLFSLYKVGITDILPPWRR
jgi:hypothetical protein